MTKLLRIAARIFGGDVLILHLQADLQTLIGQQNWSHYGLGKAPFAATVASIFFFEEPVHGPLKATAKLLGE